MKWSLRLGKLAGIDVYVHATFVLLLAWVALMDYRATGSIEGAVSGVVLILTVFAIVVLHELGHALAARRYGIPTRDITLLPIGGVARLERMPREPRQELAIALAGPAVNVVLATMLWLVLTTLGIDPLAGEFASGSPLLAGIFMVRLFWVNVILALFNMIPAFPMDGGRVLRAILAMRRSHGEATEIAARIGKFFAVVFGLAGLFYLDNPFLVFIALFIWLGAAGEASAERQAVTLAGVPTAHVMITSFRTLLPHDRLSVAMDFLLSGFQQDFPVVNERGELLGVLTRAALVQALKTKPPQTEVAEVMRRTFETASPHEPVEHALSRLRASELRALPVVDRGQLLGLLTMDNIGEWVMLQTAMSRS